MDVERTIKTKDRSSLPFLLFLLLWPVLLLALLYVGAQVWEAAQKPIVRHMVMAALDERTMQAEFDLAAADGTVRTRDMSVSGHGDAVWYVTSRFGLVPSSRESGYCYTADGDPHPYPGMEEYDEVPVMFGFCWREAGGDNGCYLEHIVGNFYYYKVWF